MPRRLARFAVAAVLLAAAARAEDTAAPAAPDEAELRRTCQVCRHGTLGFRFVVPIFVPLTAFTGQADGDEPEETPQRLQFDTGLNFGFLGQLNLRLGDFTAEATFLGVGLGTHPVLSLRNTSLQLGTVSLSAWYGQGAVKWNAAPLRLGGGARPTQLAVWPLVGVRVVSLAGSVAVAKEKLVLDGQLVWADPFVGVETVLDPPNGWAFRLLADVGGFTVSTDVTVRAQLRAEFHFLSWLSVRFGVEVLYLLATPERRFVDRVELLTYGPVVGIELGF